MNQLYLAGLKTYSGIFRKKFKGAELVLLFPSKERDYLILVITGLVTNPKTGDRDIIAVLAETIDDDDIENFIDSIQTRYGDNFLIIDKVPGIISENPNSITFKVTKAGRYLHGTLTASYNEEYSDKKHQFFSLHGDIPYGLTEDELQFAQLSMVANVKKSKIESFFSKIKYTKGKFKI